MLEEMAAWSKVSHNTIKFIEHFLAFLMPHNMLQGLKQELRLSFFALVPAFQLGHQLFYAFLIHYIMTLVSFIISIVLISHLVRIV